MAAVAVYVSSAAFWQIVVAPAVNTGVPVDGLTVTVVAAVVVPHAPVAVAVIVAVPVKPGAQSITPVVVLITPAPADTE